MTFPQQDCITTRTQRLDIFPDKSLDSFDLPKELRAHKILGCYCFKLAVNFVKGIAASALVAVLFEKTEKTRQQLFVCWKFTACCL